MVQSESGYLAQMRLHKECLIVLVKVGHLDLSSLERRASEDTHVFAPIERAETLRVRECLELALKLTTVEVVHVDLGGENHNNSTD